jgi:hypothetical protein
MQIPMLSSFIIFLECSRMSSEHELIDFILIICKIGVVIYYAPL